jgi:hypothetical protein
MVQRSTRSKLYAILVISIVMSMLALMHEKDSLVGSYVSTYFDASSVPLDRWMQSCNFDLYPNLKHDTVKSQHRNGKPVITIFVPFAVQNNWANWDSPNVDDFDFQGCSTTCIWIRNRDTSMQGLRDNAHCAAKASAVLFWNPLGHPYKTGECDDICAIQTSGLVRNENQLWLGVGTEPGMMESRRSIPSAFS